MSKKTTKPAAGDAPKPITLIVTIYPPKKNVRHVMVSGAPEGEMPLLLTGTFQERHTLLDQAFAGVLKREPQFVLTTVTTKPDKSKSVTGGVDDEESSAAEDGDQLVSDSSEPESDDSNAKSVPVSPITSSEDLPAIEGDTADQDDAQRFEAALEDLKAEQAEAVDEQEDDNA